MKHLISNLLGVLFHWKAYHSKLSLKERLEVRRLKKLIKEM